MTLPLRGLLAVALLALAFLGAGARPAAAASPCWKQLLNDWYDGRIDHTYAVSCYHAALEHLPADVQEYSSARDDIERALLDVRGRRGHPATLVPPETAATTTTAAPAAPGGGGPTTTSSRPAPSAPQETTAPLPGNDPQGGLARVAERLNPASPTSLPVPMLVLGGLAILLVAAGIVGAFVRRSQQSP